MTASAVIPSAVTRPAVTLSAVTLSAVTLPDVTRPAGTRSGAAPPDTNAPDAAPPGAGRRAAARPGGDPERGSSRGAAGEAEGGAETGRATPPDGREGPGPERGEEAVLHASCVAHAGRALLIAGPSGAGKSALAMAMIGLGARLVADDRTALSRRGGALLAAPPAAIAGLIEVRGIGLLRLPFAEGVPVAALIDLAAAEESRLPPRRTTALLGVSVTLYRRVEGAHVAAALMACLAGARTEPRPLR